METNSILRILTEMRLLESFIASLAIVVFIGAMIYLVATVKSLLEKHTNWIKKGKKLGSPG